MLVFAQKNIFDGLYKKKRFLELVFILKPIELRFEWNLRRKL